MKLRLIFNVLDIFPNNDTKSFKNNIAYLCFSDHLKSCLLTLKTRPQILSHLASSLAMLGTEIRLEKGCSEPWDSHSQ